MVYIVANFFSSGVINVCAFKTIIKRVKGKIYAAYFLIFKANQSLGNVRIVTPSFNYKIILFFCAKFYTLERWNRNE